MAELWAGVDVGGRRKGFHAIVVDRCGLADEPRHFMRASETAIWLSGLRPIVVAVDSPRSPAPAGERARRGELELNVAVCGIRWTPDERALRVNDTYYGWVLHGFELYHLLRRLGLATIECFPTASWTRWLGARAGLTRAAWTRAGLPLLALTRMPARTNQDIRDAIAAAVTAREFTDGLTEHFGDIVVPLASIPRTGLGGTRFQADAWGDARSRPQA